MDLLTNHQVIKLLSKNFVNLFKFLVVCFNHFAEGPVTEGFAVESTGVQAHEIGIFKPSSTVTWTHWQRAFNVYIEVRVQQICMLLRDCFD